jgi:hypothetical protein
LLAVIGTGPVQILRKLGFAHSGLRLPLASLPEDGIARNNAISAFLMGA